MTRPASKDGARSGTKRIFGPVPSRGLGPSRGGDVIPHKTCTFDCVYCECGATTNKTCRREEFFDAREVLDEIERWLSSAVERPDVITLSGSGEPTLYRGMGTLIEGAKRITGLPFAVITNSSLLWMDEVREELARADIVLPSLDAAIEEDYRRINRPHEECTLDRLVGGLEAFLASYRGTVLLEILLVDGYNADEANLEAMRGILGRVRADRVQLNTAVRPGTEKGVEPLDGASLERIRRSFGPRCEVIVPASAARRDREERALEEAILALLSRRPCTALDIERSLGASGERLEAILADLAGRGLVSAETHAGGVYFTARPGDGTRRNRNEAS